MQLLTGNLDLLELLYTEISRATVTATTVRQWWRNKGPLLVAQTLLTEVARPTDAAGERGITRPAHGRALCFATHLAAHVDRMLDRVIGPAKDNEGPAPVIFLQKVWLMAPRSDKHEVWMAVHLTPRAQIGLQVAGTVNLLVMGGHLMPVIRGSQ